MYVDGIIADSFADGHFRLSRELIKGLASQNGVRGATEKEPKSASSPTWER